MIIHILSGENQPHPIIICIVIFTCFHSFATLLIAKPSHPFVSTQKIDSRRHERDREAMKIIISKVNGLKNNPYIKNIYHDGCRYRTISSNTFLVKSNSNNQLTGATNTDLVMSKDIGLKQQQIITCCIVGVYVQYDDWIFYYHCYYHHHHTVKQIRSYSNESLSLDIHIYHAILFWLNIIIWEKNLDNTHTHLGQTIDETYELSAKQFPRLIILVLI